MSDVNEIIKDTEASEVDLTEESPEVVLNSEEGHEVTIGDCMYLDNINLYAKSNGRKFEVVSGLYYIAGSPANGRVPVSIIEETLEISGWISLESTYSSEVTNAEEVSDDSSTIKVGDKVKIKRGTNLTVSGSRILTAFKQTTLIVTGCKDNYCTVTSSGEVFTQDIYTSDLIKL